MGITNPERRRRTTTNSILFLVTMTAMVRNLIFSHIVVFAAGVAAGKMIDADELNVYREVHESSFTRFRRRAEKIALGTVVLGTVVLVAKMASRRSSKNY
jgi:hypothetical protein